MSAPKAEAARCAAYYTDGPHASDACSLPADHWPEPHSWEAHRYRDRRGDYWERCGELWSVPGDVLSARSLDDLDAQLGPLQRVIPPAEQRDPA